MSLAQQLLLRALIAWFWREPQHGALVRWGTTLHDRFMLPHFVWRGFSRRARRPRPGRLRLRSGMVRGAARIPLPGVAAPSSAAASSSRSARRSSPGTCWARRRRRRHGRATSIPRSSACRSRRRGLAPSRHVIACNGRRLPMTATGASGEAVAGVRFKAWKPPSGLHPTIPVARAADLRHPRRLDRPLARRLRLSRRPSGRAQLRYVPGQCLRGGGPAARAVPGSRPYSAAPSTSAARSGLGRISLDARSAAPDPL